MIRSFAVLAAIAALAAFASPAQAVEEDAAFDMRTTLEYQSWSWASPTGARLDYSTPLMVFTVMDRTGGVFGALNTVAGNEARRREAERDAIREGKRSYSWRVEEAQASEGVHLGFSVGTGPIFGATTTNGTGGGNPPTLTGNSLSAHYAKIHLEGDIAKIGPGVLVFESGTAYWSALALPPGTAYTPAGTGNTMYVEAWNWPLGLRYRINTPIGIVLEPMASFDWLYTLYYGMNGNWRLDARNVGLEAAYYLHPQVKLRGAFYLNNLAHNQVGWMKTEEVVGMRSANLGATLYF